jgi:pimeloyl-ACP methyl ester carboxylesterase
MNIVILSSIAVLIVVFTSSLIVYRTVRQRQTANYLAINHSDGIAEQRFIAVGGVEQFVQIRGEDRNNPVLLFLHGAGMSMIPFTPLFRSWEKFFTVVQWDRRGIGRTLGRNGLDGSDSWTFEDLVRDGVEVAEFILNHLQKSKLVLVGHSQGSIIGLAMANRHPGFFFAYVGTAQIADMVQNELTSYAMAVERANSSGNGKALSALRKIGAPPYGNSHQWFVKQQWSFATDPELQAWQKTAPRLAFVAPNFSIRDLVLFQKALCLCRPRFLNKP